LYPQKSETKKLRKIRVSLFHEGIPWKRVRSGGKVVWYTRFRHRGRKICVPTEARTEAERRAIEEKMKRDLDVGVENADRRGPLLTKPAYDYVQWLLTYRSQEHAIREDAALTNIVPGLHVKHLHKLRPDHIREYVDRRRGDANQRRPGKRISERTIQLEVGSFRSMLNCAVKQQWIPRNPLAGVELMPKPRYGMIDYLAPDEIVKFFESTATVEDLKKVFLLANELGCKGITVFRRGSRKAVLSSGVPGRQDASMRERPKVTSGRSEKFNVGRGSLYVHVDEDEKGLLEVFSNLGKGGGCPAQSEATARLVSLCLHCDVDTQEIVRQLTGIRCLTACSRRAGGRNVDVLSCPDGIAHAIERITGAKKERMPEDGTSATCPRCGRPREPGRCGICLSCWEGGCEGS